MINRRGAIRRRERNRREREAEGTRAPCSAWSRKRNNKKNIKAHKT